MSVLSFYYFLLYVFMSLLFVHISHLNRFVCMLIWQIHRDLPSHKRFFWIELFCKHSYGHSMSSVFDKMNDCKSSSFQPLPSTFDDYKHRIIFWIYPRANYYSFRQSSVNWSTWKHWMFQIISFCKSRAWKTTNVSKNW